MPHKKFKQGLPVWLAGRSYEMNVTAGFCAIVNIDEEGGVLRIAGASLYRIWYGDKFLGHGPARCGHNWYRVDEWPLFPSKEPTVIAIEIVGYNVDSYYLLNQPSFLQAEIEASGGILAATGHDGFSAYSLTHRIQKVQRYSFQRTFVEAYCLSQKTNSWRCIKKIGKHTDKIDVLEKKNLIARGIPLPVFSTRQPSTIFSAGIVTKNEKTDNTANKAWLDIDLPHCGYTEAELTVSLSHDLLAIRSLCKTKNPVSYNSNDSVTFDAMTYKLFDFGNNRTGFPGIHVSCKEQATVYFLFDEILQNDGDIDFLRIGCVNAVSLDIEPGSYDFETIEPYTLRYLKIIVTKGRCEVSQIYIRDYVAPNSEKLLFSASDPCLNEIFDAACLTYRQNACDIFMDCPSRERAGWLCDSFFTARAERDLCGDVPVEHNFLENFLLPESFAFLPKGMLPMCYPADHYNKNFIPNWAMWFVIELREYSRRTGDVQLVANAKERVYNLLAYFEPFINKDGLLENLEKWVFIEWSKANDFTQDVNYPSNMLYAGMLDAAADLYDDPILQKQAADIRETIRRQSFDGEFFVDNAVRNAEGVLVRTRNRTETCQYYAFFFDVATAQTYPALWKLLLNDFGPQRDATKEYPDIFPSNAFIGFFLRLDILSRYGEQSRLLKQLIQYYLPMARITGTLWEHKDTTASCNHGFASYVAHILIRDILGLRIDPVLRTVNFHIPQLSLSWCKGRIPVGKEWIEASWSNNKDVITYSLATPRNFKVQIFNESNLSIQRI